MKMKTYDQLQKSIKFYRILSAIMVLFILSIGVNNIKTTEAADGYKEQAKIEKSKREAIQQEFDDALCLPRIADMDKKLKMNA